MSAATPSYWCYSCRRFVRVFNDAEISTASALSSSVVCSDCESGFVEEIDNPTTSGNVDSRRGRRFSAAAMYMIGANNRSVSRPDHTASVPSAPRRVRRNNGDRSPFNPVIVLRGTTAEGAVTTEEGRGYELFYDDGSGSGLRSLPTTMSEFLLGSGFDRLLEQLSQFEINGMGRCEQRPASKSAIESMPTIKLDEAHITAEHHCAVCKEPFEVNTEAQEMPCKHIYHSDCIQPWLALRNSCPVCRHELPADSTPATGQGRGQEEDENAGLTIWRLPGGGFAVGRFSGGRRGAERELPVVYTEMDGGFSGGGAARRISWSRNGRRGRQSGGLRRFFMNLFGCFSGGVSSSASSSSGSEMRVGTPTPPPSTGRRRVRFMELEPTETSTPRGRRTWSTEVNSGIVRW
ncbi:E3 ubiquitin-protein ligase RING1-like [Pyrus ussuriensis x Pyrus communis]|uniref:RING-type E3 ubiquitin transferase n=1 Tax=Pyrus ussuriensis x Pyrus communis TaxID=2448454 RepID=A0A5N5F664_9ROSA|nr:probable E3 ubiquitin-protein ligase RHC2A [Pyrus x bretschneideri]KAB2598263.1 E3 ubiquitin-protein ligase RING1-like [Pyrus ussuriensis x Pyrus communis]